MPERPEFETQSPPVALIITGHFREDSRYATWRTRGVSDYLLMLTLGGAGRVGWRGGERRLSCGDIVLLRPGILHDYGTATGASGWETLWAHFAPRPHWNEFMEWPEIAAGLGLLSLTETPDFQAQTETALREMHRLERSGLPRREDYAMNALEKALLWCNAANPRSVRSALDPRIALVQEHLRENLTEPFSLTELSRRCDLSVSRLSHLFRAQVGMTPGQFLERERIARARQLLSVTSLSVAAIAESVGFASPFYFCARFKKRTGFNPSEFRRQQ